MSETIKQDFKLYFMIVGAVLGGIAILAVGVNLYAASQPVEITPEPYYDTTNMEYLIHQKVNEYRTFHGLTTLSFDHDLAAIARAHSQDMVDRNYFEHFTPEGKTFDDRYQESGYTCRIMLDDRIGMGGENLALTYAGFSEDEITQEVVDGWMNSLEHQKVMLTGYYSNQGIGVIQNDDEFFITQNFC